MIADKIRTLPQNRLLQHILFWCFSCFVLLKLFSGQGKVEKIDYIYTALFHLTIIPGVYINLLILIPRLLSKKKYVWYLLSLLALIPASAGINITFFDKWVGYLIPGYYFISYYGFTDIIKFVTTFIAITTLLKLSKGWFMLSDANLRLSKLQKEKAESELKALRGQINPHFLFNSLNSIYSLALNKSEKTPEAVLKLSNLMRYIIYEANVDSIDLSKEVKYLRDYIDLQKLRSDNRATVNFDISGKLKNISIAPLLFFPLVENSFKHGIKGSTGKSYVTISLQTSGKKVSFIIENNKGFSDDVENADFKGIGLENVRKRLEMIYPGENEFIVTDSGEMFRVELIINNPGYVYEN
jgi:sensor histidine kinase YesM